MVIAQRSMIDLTPSEARRGVIWFPGPAIEVDRPSSRNPVLEPESELSLCITHSQTKESFARGFVNGPFRALFSQGPDTDASGALILTSAG